MTRVSESFVSCRFFSTTSSRGMWNLIFVSLRLGFPGFHLLQGIRFFFELFPPLSLEFRVSGEEKNSLLFWWLSLPFAEKKEKENQGNVVTFLLASPFRRPLLDSTDSPFWCVALPFLHDL